MKTPFLLTLLLAVPVLQLCTQYHVRCGDFRGVIKGEKIAEANVKDSVNRHSTTYAYLDKTNDRIWFWVEDNYPNHNKTEHFMILWGSLSNLHVSSTTVYTGNPSMMLVKLTNTQQFFFTTHYYDQQKGPRYEVRNQLMIHFDDAGSAAAFAEKLRQYFASTNKQ